MDKITKWAATKDNGQYLCEIKVVEKDSYAAPRYYWGSVLPDVYNARGESRRNQHIMNKEMFGVIVIDQRGDKFCLSTLH